MKTYQALSSKLNAIDNCKASGNEEWYAKHLDAIEAIMQGAPSGSGIDCGTKLDETSTSEKLKFVLSFHHMNDGGMYDGWTEHVATVKPSLQFGYTLSISGRDRNMIKDYLREVLSTWLDEECNA